MNAGSSEPVPDTTHTDDVVAAHAAAGDPDAFRVLFRAHRDAVARLVYRLMGHCSEHDDLVQEVFVQVFRSLKDFRGQAKLSTWIHRVTVNVVRMHRRAARSRPVLSEEVADDYLTDDSVVLPDDELELRERIRAFRRLVDKLAEKKRVVFVLHDIEGMAPAAIAEIVGAPLLTVRTRLFYARRELEAMLDEEPSLAGLIRSDHEQA
jgi:RNA polymerase sigma-70 factor (ECF subfamily)